MVLMSREIDSCYVPVPIDSAIKNIAGLPNYYYGTPVLNVVGDSLMIRDAQWDPFSRYYITAPFGGFYINNVVNKRVAYVKVNDTLLVNYSTDFGNDTLRVSPPPKYKVYTASIAAMALMDPMVTEIYDNTIGEIVWTRIDDGIYRGTLTGAFVEGKTYCTATNLVYSDVDDAQIASLSWLNANTLKLTARTMSSGTAGPMTTVNIEIRVYK
jgi:hypothetical protein